MRTLLKKHKEFLDVYKTKYKDKRKVELLENIFFALGYLNSYDSNKKTVDLIFNNIKENIHYPTSHLIALNDYVEKITHMEYDDLDEMLNYSLSKERPFYHRETLWEIIDKDLKTNGIDSGYLKLRDYLQYEDLDAKIFRFKEDKVSHSSYDIEQSWYTRNDYLASVFKTNPLKYTQSFLNKLENSYDKIKELETEMEEMEY